MSRWIQSFWFAAGFCALILALRFVEQHAFGWHMSGYDIGDLAIISACSYWGGTGWGRA